jgi:hypothetical protein
MKNINILSKYLLFSATFILLGFFISITEGAVIEQLPQVGAKSAAFGDAFVAVADDAYAVFSNPAGLSQLKHIRGTFSKFRPNIYSSLSEHFLSAIIPLNSSDNSTVGAVGFSWLHFGSIFYKEDTVVISGSIAPYLKGIAIGGNIKLFRMSIASINDIHDILGEGQTWFNLSDPLLMRNGDQSEGIGDNVFPLIDIGALYRMNKNLQFGVCLNNLINNDINWTTKTTENDIITKENHNVSLPTTLRIGTAYFRLYSISDGNTTDRNPKVGKVILTASGEFLQDIISGDRTYMSMGGELLFADFSPEPMDIAVRTGVTFRNGFHLRGSVGLGIRYMYQENWGFLFDYTATKIPLDWRHSVSISFVIAKTDTEKSVKIGSEKNAQELPNDAKKE